MNPDDPVHDGARALRDTEEEAGDEGELTDVFALDHEEARELGVDLDPVEDEPQLD